MLIGYTAKLAAVTDLVEKLTQDLTSNDLSAQGELVDILEPRDSS